MRRMALLVSPILTLAAAVGLQATAASAATVRYVAPTGAAVAPGASCDLPGYNSIGAAVADAAAGDTIVVCGGTYFESNISMDRPLTIDGHGNPKIVPAGEDANLNSAFGGVVQNGFVVRSSDVTIRDLTLDGEGNPALTPGKNNFRMGIVTDFGPGQPSYERLTVENVTVKHVYRRAVQFGQPSVRSTGHSISGSRIEDTTISWGIAAFDADITISGNRLQQVFRGILANTGNLSSGTGPLCSVSGNRIRGDRQGLQLLACGHGSVVTGNHIDIRGGTTGFAVAIDATLGTLTFGDNEVRGSHGDKGIELLHNDEDSDVRIVGNVVRSEQSAPAPDNRGGGPTTLGTGTGLFMTDDGAFTGEADSSNYATVIGNDIRGWYRGVHVYRNGRSPAGGRPVQPPTRGSFAQNCFQNNGTAMLVDGVNAAAYGDVLAEDNWWGHVDGPSGTGTGSGDAVHGPVDFTPWATTGSICRA